MPRHLVLVSLVLGGSAGCAEAPLRPAPLPELVTAVAARDLRLIDPGSLLLTPGEAFLWDVHWRGITVARAELFVDEGEVRSRVETGALASSIAKLRYELTTVLDRERGQPRGGEEILVEEADTRSAEVGAGKPGHTMHTALGVLRVWARPGASPGWLPIAHLGERYRLDLDMPIAEDLQGTPALKLVGRLRLRDAAPITIAIWLTADPGRVPMRFEIAHDGSKITAELVRE